MVSTKRAQSSSKAAKRKKSSPYRRTQLKPYQINSQIPLAERQLVPFANENDVVFGRGTCLSRLPGCLLFRKVCWHYKQKYVKASIAEKQQTAQMTLDYMRSIGGRFLEYIVIRGKERLAHVPEPRVVEKACQTLREQKLKKPEGFAQFVKEKAYIVEYFNERGPRRINIHVHEKEKWSYYSDEGDAKAEYAPPEASTVTTDEIVADNDDHDDTSQESEELRRTPRIRRSAVSTYAYDEIESEEEETVSGEEADKSTATNDEEEVCNEREEETSLRSNSHKRTKNATKGKKASSRKATDAGAAPKRNVGRPRKYKRPSNMSDAMQRMMQTHGPFSNLVRQACSARAKEDPSGSSGKRGRGRKQTIQHDLLEGNKKSGSTSTTAGKPCVLIVRSNNKVVLTRDYKSMTKQAHADTLSSGATTADSSTTPAFVQSGTLYRKAALNACAAITNLARSIPRTNRRTSGSISPRQKNGKFVKREKVVDKARSGAKRSTIKIEIDRDEICRNLRERARTQMRDKDGRFVKNQKAVTEDLELLVKEACDAVHLGAIGQGGKIGSHEGANGHSMGPTSVTKLRISSLGKVPRTKRTESDVDAVHVVGNKELTLEEDESKNVGMADTTFIPSPLVRNNKKSLIDDESNEQEDLQACIPPSFQPFSSGIFSVQDGDDQELATNTDDIPPPPYALAFQTSKTWDGVTLVASKTATLECEDEIVEKPILASSFSSMIVEPPALTVQHSLDLRGDKNTTGGNRTMAGLHRAFSGMTVEAPGLNIQHSLMLSGKAGESDVNRALPLQSLRRNTSDCGDDLLMEGNFDSEAAKFISARS